ncbi:MAG: hypothetical protein ACRCXL_01010 [Dermatophilaceae bacterium]
MAARSTARRLLPVAALTAVVLGGGTGLVACEGDPAQTTPPTSGGGSSPSGSSTEKPADTLGATADKVLAFGESDPVATLTGTVKPNSGPAVPGKAEVVRLSVEGASAVLLLRLSSSDSVSPQVSAFEADDNGGSVDGIKLTAGGRTFYPGNYRYGEAVLAQECVCTALIRRLGPEGVWVSAHYEALPAGTTAATLTIPGFDPASVPVTTG